MKLKKAKRTLSSPAFRYALATVLMILFIYLAYSYVSANYQNFTPENVNKVLQTYGLLGIFIAAIIANATLFFPVPLDVAIFFLGQFDIGFGIVSPLALGFFAGLGSAIGEMSGYIVGTLGIRSLEKLKKSELKQIDRLQRKINKYGFSVIALAALTPFPFDLVGIAAGLIKFNPKHFFFACSVGKIVRYVLIAYAGMFSVKALAWFFGIA